MIPSSAARSALIRRQTSPPSFTPGAFPAVTLPGSPVTVLLWPKTGGSLASPSIVVSGRGPSSCLRTEVFFPSRISTGKISSSSRPAFIASTAASWEWSAHSS